MSGVLDFEDHIQKEYRLSQLQQLPLPELQSLYKKALYELIDIKTEFDDFQLTSKEYEQELELANDSNQKRCEELEEENDKTRKELQKIQQKYKNEVSKVEKENDFFKKQLEDTGDMAKLNIEKLKNLEIDNEGYERQLRISEQIIQDLEQKLDSSLEELALLQSELEEYKLHSQEQLERLKQQLEETNTELQVKERELKRIKFQQLISESTNPHQQQVTASSFHNSRTNYVSLQKGAAKPRLSEGENGNAFQKLNTYDQSRGTKTLNFYQGNNEGEQDHDDIFERADIGKRPESARTKFQQRDSLMMGHAQQQQQLHQSQNTHEDFAVKEEQDSSSIEEESKAESKTVEEEEQSQQEQQHDDFDIESVKVEHVEDEDDKVFEVKSDHQQQKEQIQKEIEVRKSQIKAQAQQETNRTTKRNSVLSHQEKPPLRNETQHDYSKFNYNQQNFILQSQEGLGPYITSHSYGGGLNNLLSTQNEFEENLLMEDLDIEELLECDDIESNAFLGSSKQLLSVIDNMITSIDDRIRYKKNGYYGGNYYYQGGTGNPAAPGYQQEEYPMGSFRENNLFGGHGYHKHQSQSTNMNTFNHGNVHNHHGGVVEGHRQNATDVFDKTRKVSVLY